MIKSPFINRLCSQPGAHKRDIDEINPYGVSWLRKDVPENKEKRKTYIQFKDYKNTLDEIYK